MNKKQWYVLSISSIIMMLIFIALDGAYWGCLGSMYGTLSVSDVWCIVNGEIYEPFIHLSYALSLVFLIMGFLEAKKR